MSTGGFKQPDVSPCTKTSVAPSTRSVRLTELDDADDAWDPNLTAEEPAALDDANEKALTTLGVEERWKYKEARRVVM